MDELVNITVWKEAQSLTEKERIYISKKHK